MTSATQTFDRRDAVDAAAVALMLLLTFSWGLNGVAAKLANAGYNPIFLNVARSAIACVLVFMWCRYRRVPLFESDGTLWAGIAAGILFGSEFTLIFVALEFTTVARNSLLVNTMPFWILIGAHFLLGERMSVQKFLGLLLAFGGVVLVFSDKLSIPGPEAITGDLLSLGAGLLWALTTLVIKGTRLSTASAEKVLLYQLAVSAVIAVPLIPLAGSALRDVTPLATGALLFQAVYVVAFTYILWFWLMRRYPAAGLSSFTFLSPAFSVICGWLLLGEPLTWKIFAALGLIAAGLIIVNRPGAQAGTCASGVRMRDLLNDLDAQKYLSDPDPIRRAQSQMKTQLPKRFYKDVSIASAGEGFGVHLDGRPVRTPGKAILALPTEKAAGLVAEEFAAQGEKIDPSTMPVYRLVNTAIDGVAADPAAVRDDVARFASSDLLCYRADAPAGLGERQARAWDPVLDWAQRALGARLLLAEGVIHVEQPRKTVEAIEAHLALRQDPLRLAALHLMTTLTGSALLAIAVEAGEIDAETAWSAAHVDEDWQAEQWGQDSEAMARRAYRNRDMMAAARLLEALER